MLPERLELVIRSLCHTSHPYQGDMTFLSHPRFFLVFPLDGSQLRPIVINVRGDEKTMASELGLLVVDFWQQWATTARYR